MANNYIGYEKLIRNVRTFDEGHITWEEFLETHSRICFNDISSNTIDRFSEGYTKDCTLTLLRYILKVVDGDKNAERIVHSRFNIFEHDLDYIRGDFQDE